MLRLLVTRLVWIQVVMVGSELVLSSTCDILAEFKGKIDELKLGGKIVVECSFATKPVIRFVIICTSARDAGNKELSYFTRDVLDKSVESADEFCSNAVKILVTIDVTAEVTADVFW